VTDQATESDVTDRPARAGAAKADQPTGADAAEKDRTAGKPSRQEEDTVAQADGRGLVVAIDGPSGSGKSTISRRLATELDLAYLDTGAMYRAATWWCLRRGVDLTDVDGVAAVVRQMPLVMVTDPAAPRVVCDDVDITEAIRASELSAVVSKVATNLDVRAELGRLQREIIAAEAGRNGIVAEGRDITTVVAPDADVRLLLIADEAARLARRAKELHGTADEATVARTRDEVVRRDADDSTVSTFMTAADGVVTVDSSAYGVEETFQAVLAVVEAARAGER
jgi:cytidylate kinase